MPDTDATPDAGVFAALAVPLRWAAWFFWLITALTLIDGALGFLDGATPDAGSVVAPAILGGLGFLLLTASRRCRRPGELELAKVAGAVFMTVGGTMVAGGIALAFEEPGGLVLAGMGVVFGGAGYAARRFLATPAGMKAVSASSMRAAITTRYGTRGVRTQSSIIYVNEDATEAEIETLRHRWLKERVDERPDWSTGRVEGEDQRSGSLPFWVAGAWMLFTACLSAAAFFWDESLRIFAGMAALMTLGFVVFALRVALRRRKFGPSLFQMERVPALLGARLGGEVQTGIDQRWRPRGPFAVSLRCIYFWEERDRERRTRQRVDVLWEQEQRCTSRAWGSGPMRHAVGIGFEVPADQPITTLGGGSEGIRWEIEVRAELSGLDYVGRFEIPVFHPDDNPLPLHSSSPVLP